MNTRFVTKHKYMLLFFSFVIVVTSFAFVFFQYQNKLHTRDLPIQPLPTATTPNRVTLQGEVVCLPHKDTTGPQTLECSIGLMDEKGFYYALDNSLMSQSPPEYTTGDIIEASGVLTPLEYLSSDHWQKYNIKGIFSITDSLTVLK